MTQDVVEYLIIDDSIFQQIQSICLLKDGGGGGGGGGDEAAGGVEHFKEYIYDLCIKYNQDKKEIIRDLFHYIIKTSENISTELLDFMEEAVHNENYEDYLNFVFYRLRRRIISP
jgi:hypothetical protein